MGHWGKSPNATLMCSNWPVYVGSRVKQNVVGLMCYCIKPTSLADKVCGTVYRQASGFRHVSILSPFGNTKWFTFISSGSSLESLVYKVEFPKAPEWLWMKENESSRYATEGICALPWPSGWPSLSDSVSKSHRKWADTAPSKAGGKKTSTQKTPSCICLCFSVSYGAPLIVFPCENVYSASHSSQPPHSLILMPSKAIFSVSAFKSAFDFGSVPFGFSGVRLYSFGIEISLDFRFREQTLRHCEEHNKVSEVSWVWKNKTQGLLVTGLSASSAGLNANWQKRKAKRNELEDVEIITSAIGTATLNKERICSIVHVHARVWGKELVEKTYTVHSVFVTSTSYGGGIS